MQRVNYSNFPGSLSRVTRRHATVLVGCGIAAGAFRPARAAAAVPADMLFDVYRKGDRIGTHAIRFTQDGGGLRVASQLDLTVKMAFITVYRYEQTGQDDWQDGALVRTSIRTIDDGKDTLVVAEAKEGKLVVEGPAGTYETSLGSMTDLSFWNEGITDGPPVIDSQTGELIKISVQPDATETITVRGQPVSTRRFTMAATKGRSGTVWYDGAGGLVKAIVLTRGETLAYALAA
jgi:Family of unknown function (DUF6134)